MFNAVDQCRICRCRDLNTVFDLGSHALSGRFPGPEDSPVPEGPLVLLQCDDCGLAQLGHDYDADELYRHDYGYRSGLNATMRNHLKGVVDDALARQSTLGTGDVVLDIGSNDGTLLGHYAEPGLVRIGMDPTIEQFGHHYDTDIHQIADFFTAERFLREAPAKARIITSIAMFYDLPDPNAFVADIARCLSDDGLWILEQSYVKTMLERNAFDTICHEHVEYYGLRQICDLAGRNGLKVIDVSLNDVNGGSFRAVAAHQDFAAPVHPRVEEALAEENSFGLDGPGPYLAFRDRVNSLRDALRALVHDITSDGKTIYLYGASTKGNVLLQYFGLGNQDIVAAADRNPEKWGRLTPGTRIPIISEAEARAQTPDYFLVLPWHFREEFVEREADFLAAGGRMIFPLPEIEIV